MTKKTAAEPFTMSFAVKPANFESWSCFELMRSSEKIITPATPSGMMFDTNGPRKLRRTVTSK